MLQLDHLVFIAPTLEAGADEIERLLGVRPWYGGIHRELGTHNMLLRIGDDVFLEVISCNPTASHHGPRVFGLTADGLPQFHLATWVGRTEDLTPYVTQFGPHVGQVKSVTRGTRHWHMAIPPDGSLPGGGYIPTPVVYEPGMIPAKHMPVNELQLREVVIEHPDAAYLRQLYDAFHVLGAITIQQKSPAKLMAVIETPRGVVVLG